MHLLSSQSNKFGGWAFVLGAPGSAIVQDFQGTGFQGLDVTERFNVFGGHI